MTATTSPLRAADIAARAERRAHAWNSSSEMVGTTLGRALEPGGAVSEGT